MSDQNFSAIRAKLRYETIEEFIEGYARFISAGGMFIPMKPEKIKPVGSTIRFQFLLGDGSTALLGEGVVLQVRDPDPLSPQSPVGMLIKFTKLAQDSKALVDRIVADKADSPATDEFGEPAQDIHNDRTPVPRDENVYTDRTPLPPDKETYERQTRASFEGQGVSLNDLLAKESVDPTDHSKQTDHGLEDEGDGGPVNDVFESDDEANDALAAAALAVSEEPQEDPQTAESPGDPETREAPEVSHALAESAPKGPLKLGETAGGLKILAFDEDIDDTALRALEEFSFGAEESDIDDMFDGLFGGGDDDGMGGLFGGAPEPASAADANPSMEMEVPNTLTQEVADELVEEEALLADAQEDHDELSASPDADEAPSPGFSLEDLGLDDDGHEVAPHAEAPVADDEPLDTAPADHESPDVERPAVDEPAADDGNDLGIDFDDLNFGDEPEGAEPQVESPTGDEPIAEVPVEATPAAAQDDDARPSPGFSLEDLGLDDDEEPAPAPEPAQPAKLHDFSLEELGLEENAPAPDVAAGTVVESPNVREASGSDAFDDDEPAAEAEASEAEELLLDDEVEMDPSSVAEEESLPAPPVAPVFQAAGAHVVTSSGEDISNLLGSLDEPSNDMSLHLASEAEEAPVEATPAADDDADSLAALLAGARREIEEKSNEEPRESGDILDQLLGDDLPPPPSDAPAFQMPQPEKKKKGFLSKLFDK